VARCRRGGDISRFDRATGTLTRYTAADGLASDSTYGSLEDAAGFLWASTRNGLSRFDRRAAELRSFDAADGLRSLASASSRASPTARTTRRSGTVSRFP
jgi:streptogramin lyase